ncbi:PEBP-like protein [Ascobolus immersus RN42]|uniref:PEBP-like protein n=1 Tax=Ascobolus immersus RN42 TaxID=1160509 RepID=A0A3N4ICZ6_ASCIM|nr:PEBP-like protein [Ascobolus immersus RN42]
MKFLFPLSLIPLAALAQVLPVSWPTNVAPAFTPLANLTVTFPKHTISNANSGVFLPITEVQAEPTLSLDPPLSGTFLLFMIDPDVQPAWANILHAFKTDITGDATTGVLSGGNPRTPWFGPGAPKGDPPHHYTWVVYRQPANFRVPNGFNAGNRIAFKLADFVRNAGLGAPVAGQYLTTVTP